MADKNIAIISLTTGGRELANRLAELLPAIVLSSQGQFKKKIRQAWQEYDSLICIMATGIVVRTLAPLLKDKREDPAVVVCDEKGQFAISLLSGHLGGGNALAQQVAGLLNGQAVITTASDVLGRTALDIWTRDQGLVVADKHRLTRSMAQLVNNGSVSLSSDYPVSNLPKDIQLQDDAATADLVITCHTDQQISGACLYPKSLVAGIGCNRNTPEKEIKQALHEACKKNNINVAFLQHWKGRRTEK